MPSTNADTLFLCQSFSGELAAHIKTECKASLLSPTLTGASWGGSPSTADVRAAVRAELLQRVRQAEQKAELQQRKQQQEHRQQLEQLAESLRAVEKDVEAVKSALAVRVTRECSQADDTSSFAYSRPRSRWLRRITSSPVRSEPYEPEVHMLNINPHFGIVLISGSCESLERLERTARKLVIARRGGILLFCFQVQATLKSSVPENATKNQSLGDKSYHRMSQTTLAVGTPGEWF